jgi:hypothetical protein
MLLLLEMVKLGDSYETVKPSLISYFGHAIDLFARRRAGTFIR